MGLNVTLNGVIRTGISNAEAKGAADGGVGGKSG